ncbi:MAG TPA: hypothetical protein VND96_07365 [Candidatus Micrarchaeaceae archaeon]|nr:hypothetical protein [Candidatus Micrarchaeaceae archaeon]
MARANYASDPEFAPPVACICQSGQGPPGENEGLASIGALSRGKGSVGFGTRYRYRTDGSLGDDAGDYEGQALPVDLAINAQGLGAYLIRVRNVEEFPGRPRRRTHDRAYGRDPCADRPVRGRAQLRELVASNGCGGLGVRRCGAGVSISWVSAAAGAGRL